MVSIKPFNQPLPSWISDIKTKARITIAGAGFVSACRDGDRAVMQGLVIGLWPFIHAFPIALIRGASMLSRKALAKNRPLLNTLLHRGQNILSGIRSDETNHRELWLQTGNCLALTSPANYQRPTLSETQAWIDAVNTETDPFVLFVRFAAIEIIAEAISEELLLSEAFVSALGERGTEWFRVHARHGKGMTHEELELRLAFGFLDGSPDKNQTNSIIQHVVGLFLSAANASAWNGQSICREIQSAESS